MVGWAIHYACFVRHKLMVLWVLQLLQTSQAAANVIRDLKKQNQRKQARKKKAISKNPFLFPVVHHNIFSYRCSQGWPPIDVQIQLHCFLETLGDHWREYVCYCWCLPQLGSLTACKKRKIVPRPLPPCAQPLAPSMCARQPPGSSHANGCKICPAIQPCRGKGLQKKNVQAVLVFVCEV